MMKKSFFLILLLASSAGILNASASLNLTTKQNQLCEWSYISTKIYDSPFRDISLHAKITFPDGMEILLPAYWSGNMEWRFRFSSPNNGEYKFVTICSDKKNRDLHGQTGSISVLPYDGDNPLFKHGPLKISEDKKHLVHDDGTPFFWLADSWWHGMTSRFKWPEDFQILTADRKEKNFSVIQFALGHPCDIEPFDPRGQNEAGDAWMDSTFASINPEYFELTDLRINWLVRNGLMPNLMGTWGYYMKWAGVENMKKYWEYIIARYGAYPCTWMVAGEVTLAYYPDLEENWDYYKAQFREQWSEVARHIRKFDPFKRLVTVHPGPGALDGKPPINDMGTIDFVLLQSGHSGYHTLPGATTNVRKAMQEYPSKPVMHGEVCFEGMHGEGSGSKVQRFLFWSNMLMGTSGFSYGVEGIWQFNTEEELFGASPGGNTWGNVPWEVAYQYPGSKQLGIGKSILEKFEWWRLKPAQDLISYNSSDETFIPYCAANENIRVVYMYDFPARWRNYKCINLEPEINYTATWYDPITGDEYLHGNINPDDSGKWQIPRPPIMQDWVLVIKTSE